MKSQKVTSFVTVILLIFLSMSAYANIQKSVGNTYVFIKSENLNQFNTVITGFMNRLPNAKLAIFDMQGKHNEWKIKKFLEAKKPSVIITLGSLATNTTVKIEKKLPIIFAMVINYKKYSFSNQNNVTGISMEIPPQKLFNQFRMLLPKVKSIGVPFNPEASAEIVSDALFVASKMDIKLVGIKVKNPDNITAKLHEKINSYDALWMLADTKLYNSSTNATQKLMFFSNKYAKPLLVFSEAFLQSGAFFSITIDYHSLGMQIAFIADKIFTEKLVPNRVKIASPIGIYRVLNEENAKLLEENFDE
ncbi:MAG: ABC transporter substrate binding protein [Candidatus Marithrix sp.]